MELNSSHVYETLQPLAKTTDPAVFIAALRRLCQYQTIRREAADNLIHSITSSLFNLASHKLFDEATQVVEACLDTCAELPISAEKRWYFVGKALTVIKSKPELATQLASNILRDTLTEEYDFNKVVQLLAELGQKDLALAYALQAIDLGFDVDITRENFIAIKKIYDTDQDFKTTLDSALIKQAEKQQRIANPVDFSSRLEAAHDAIHNLRISYSDPGEVLAVIAFKQPEYRTQIENFLASGFQQLKQFALRSSKLIDPILFDALARAIGNWGDPKFGNLLMQEFNYVTAEADKNDPDYIPRHYELNQTCGTIALALAALNYRGDTKGFDNFLQSFEWRYPGSDFVMQVRYAKWLLEKDTEGAAAFLQEPENSRGASYAVSALSDLDCKAALPIIKQRQATLCHPITQEVFKEAIARLEQQQQPPQSQNRIIVLFGRVTPIEMALGAESDNIFLRRAQQTLQRPHFGTLYDEEELAPED